MQQRRFSMQLFQESEFRPVLFGRSSNLLTFLRRESDANFRRLKARSVA